MKCQFCPEEEIGCTNPPLCADHTILVALVIRHPGLHPGRIAELAAGALSGKTPMPAFEAWRVREALCPMQIPPDNVTSDDVTLTEPVQLAFS